MELDRVERLTENEDFISFTKVIEATIQQYLESYGSCHTEIDFLKNQERVKTLRFVLTLPDLLKEQREGS